MDTFRAPRNCAASSISVTRFAIDFNAAPCVYRSHAAREESSASATARRRTGRERSAQAYLNDASSLSMTSSPFLLAGSRRASCRRPAWPRPSPQSASLPPLDEPCREDDVLLTRRRRGGLAAAATGVGAFFAAFASAIFACAAAWLACGFCLRAPSPPRRRHWPPRSRGDHRPACAFSSASSIERCRQSAPPRSQHGEHQQSGRRPSSTFIAGCICFAGEVELRKHYFLAHFVELAPSRIGDQQNVFRNGISSLSRWKLRCNPLRKLIRTPCPGDSPPHFAPLTPHVPPNAKVSLWCARPRVSCAHFRRAS